LLANLDNVDAGALSTDILKIVFDLKNKPEQTSGPLFRM